MNEVASDALSCTMGHRPQVVKRKDNRVPVDHRDSDNFVQIVKMLSRRIRMKRRSPFGNKSAAFAKFWAAGQRVGTGCQA